MLRIKIKDVRILTGAVLVLIIVLSSLFGPMFFDTDYRKLEWRERNKPLSLEHWFGTDPFGRDLLSMVLLGGRISLLVGMTATTIVAAIGILVGVIAAWFAAFDRVVMRVMDLMMSIPSMVLAIALVAFLGASFWNVITAIVLTQIPRFARVVRSSSVSVKEQCYIEAAQSYGTSTWRIVLHHMLPNCFGTIMVQATFLFAHAMIVESALSYMGVGMPLPLPSWGNLIAEGRAYVVTAWWQSVLPGFTLGISVLGLNVLGDGLRDRLDPRLRGKI